MYRNMYKIYTKYTQYALRAYKMQVLCPKYIQYIKYTIYAKKTCKCQYMHEIHIKYVNIYRDDSNVHNQRTQLRNFANIHVSLHFSTRSIVFLTLPQSLINFKCTTIIGMFAFHCFIYTFLNVPLSISHSPNLLETTNLQHYSVFLPSIVSYTLFNSFHCFSHIAPNVLFMKGELPNTVF